MSVLHRTELFCHYIKQWIILFKTNNFVLPKYTLHRKLLVYELRQQFCCADYSVRSLLMNTACIKHYKYSDVTDWLVTNKINLKAVNVTSRFTFYVIVDSKAHNSFNSTSLSMQSTENCPNSTGYTGMNQYEAFVGWCWPGKAKVLTGKPVPLPFCSP